MKAYAIVATQEEFDTEFVGSPAKANAFVRKRLEEFAAEKQSKTQTDG